MGKSEIVSVGAIDPIGLSVIRLGVHLLLASRGRGFGKLRFLRGWLSSCGPQPTVGFLPWII